MPNDEPLSAAPAEPPSDVLTTASHGMLIRAENADVVAIDEKGLTLRLSETVLAELRQRLAVNQPSPLDVAVMLGDIDAWNLRQEGEWLKFTGQLEAGVAAREYQRSIDGGDIIASAPGPIYALFSLGGARRADFNEGPSTFSHHILAPSDDIGAVGLEGTALAKVSAGLQRIPHCTRDAHLAETLLGWRREGLRGLPLFLVRSETDASAAIADLGQGVAYANFLTALESLVAAAASLGKRAKVLSVGIDFSIEDQSSTPAEFVKDFRALMAQIERDMARRNLQRPIFLATFECGTRRVSDHAAIRAHWELAWAHGTHQFAFSAPGYMFEQTRFGRPTASARIAMAEMDAHAIVALTNREPWACPLFLLAEYLGNEIRVTAQAMGDLVIEDAFGAGPACGFSLSGTTAPVNILSVAVALDDPKALILTCDGPPKGAAVELRYAFGATGSGPDAYPVNRGAVRDQWVSQSRTGRSLHRWALPAALPLHPGAR